MSEMVRRVAKIVRDFTDQESASGYIHPVYLRVATDILAAMREPTDEMPIAAQHRIGEAEQAGEGPTSAGHYMEMAWRAMIDEALKS